ncbi:hypothetical protein EPUS_01021 [Endocarpon pusillum Z07020]|uniref:L-dopachrome isomerase n=1 Tax=Endocarpon pusillum (strain Z07020 / HMAS-L-300199) TaxID=1263415 RepID=U1HG19_ENDPU|nr:uncharacterized protein EPUS_01021 [Endocarpon pusillum Z07020]ERF69065.1 hypothetical protein EPUS_01021 [Endocarpon pusillum Z07020]
MEQTTPARDLESSPPQGSHNLCISDIFPKSPRAANNRSLSTQKTIVESQRAASTPPEMTNENYVRTSSTILARDLPMASELASPWDHQQLSKKRSQYYGGFFAYREPHNTAKDRVIRDSVIIAEIKLNCKLQVEQTFLSDISFQLSEIYQRPESCILVSVCTSQAMLFGGSSEPAYYLTITALASEIAPTKNKRSTALVQGFMQETLDIAPRRGIICFDSVLEENLATNGMTALQEIEELERHSSEDSRALRSISRNRSRKGKRGYAPAFMERVKTPMPHIITHEKFSSRENDDGKPSAVDSSEKKRLKRRKSFMAFFGR